MCISSVISNPADKKKRQKIVNFNFIVTVSLSKCWIIRKLIDKYITDYKFISFSQFSGCWLILCVYILMSFDFLCKIVRSSVILLLPLFTDNNIIYHASELLFENHFSCNKKKKCCLCVPRKLWKWYEFLFIFQLLSLFYEEKTINFPDLVTFTLNIVFKVSWKLLISLW
jgi:hypothetical protein